MKFEFEKSPAKKGMCPSCQQKDTYRYYEDLPRQYGKCERVNNCGYFNDPHQEPLEVQLELQGYSSTGSENKKKKVQELETIYLKAEQVKPIINNQNSTFHIALLAYSLLSSDHLTKWNVGTDTNGNTCFVISDKKHIYNIKTIKYDTTGKRDKSKYPFYMKAPKGKKYSRCLYGLHLLEEDKTICLVESEKTAVLASFFYPQFNWLATGGSNGLTGETISALFNKKIYYLCDADKAGRENSTIKKLQDYKQNFFVVDLFPERNDGNDLADYLLNDYLVNHTLPEIKEMQQKEQPKAAPNSVWEQVEEFISERYEIHSNEVANKIEYRPKDVEDSKFEELNENDIYRELKVNYINFSLGNLKAMLGSSFVKKFNPIADYFENLKPYDPKTEIDYIDTLGTYLPIIEEDRDVFKVQFKKMFVRMIACSLYNVVNKQAFILVHDGQNSGKSTFCRWLCPPVLENYIAENPGLDKDGLISMCTNFIINLDEVGKTFNKAEINQLKSIISKDVFKGRLPYAARESRLIRRANFIGSTNDSAFLNDETGSVRWLCFEIEDQINFDYSKDIDINRVWAQAFYMLKNGFQYQLTLQEIAENERRNKKYSVTSLEYELIQRFFFPPGIGNYREKINVEQDIHFKTSTDIKLILAQKAPGERTYEAKIGKALKSLGYKRMSKRMIGYEHSIYGYYIVEKG
ncbi:MAG: DUF6371 domain-containing protein [Crocinitomicaceae bacterium]|nr:DUF6371 domain-containing protein [Crocinitomicaceae bacterium]